ncbi:tRNA pseudouridine(55) synthase TruB [Mycoplasma sp. 5912]
MFYKFFKESGVYSNREIRALGKKLGVKKIGHSGILDQLASGLMIVATDSDTKLLDYISNKNKAYIAKAKFGYSSDTLDSNGDIQKENVKQVNLDNLQQAVYIICTQEFQIPPKYSAKRIKGRRAYDLARQGIDIELKSHKIKVIDYKILDFDYENQEYTIYFLVSNGTYIRVLLEDIAKQLNNSSIMTELKRIKVGNIDIDDLKPTEHQKISIFNLFDYNILKYTENEYKYLINGREFECDYDDGILMWSDAQNQIVSVGLVRNKIFFPKKVFLERLKWKI